MCTDPCSKPSTKKAEDIAFSTGGKVAIVKSIDRGSSPGPEKGSSLPGGGKPYPAAALQELPHGHSQPVSSDSSFPAAALAFL